MTSPSNPTLYELTDDLIALDELLNELGGEVTDETAPIVADWAERLQLGLTAKVDRIGRYWRTLEASALSCKAEAQRLQERAKAQENKIKGLRFIVAAALTKLGLRKLEGQEHTFALQRNGGSGTLVVTAPLADIPAAYWTPQEPVLNKAKLKADVEAGVIGALAVARIEPPGEGVRLR